MTRAVPPWWVLRQRGTTLLTRFGGVRVGVTAVLLLGWLVAVVLAVTTSDVDLTCTPADPSVCGPESGAAWLGVSFATPVLLCWRPRLGAVAGMVFAVAEYAFDGDPAGHLPFGVHGVLCLLGFVVLRPVGRASAYSTTYSSYGSRAEPARRHPYFDDADPRELLRRRPSATVLGGAFVLLALICVGRYAQLVAEEHRHVAASVQVLGTVDEVDPDDWSITLLLAEPDGGVRNSGPVDVLDVGPYPRDTTVPVLVDPDDTGWVRLVAEPQDATGWLIGASFLLTLAVAIGVDRRSRRHAGPT